jgi:hypothetical protein
MRRTAQDCATGELNRFVEEQPFRAASTLNLTRALAPVGPGTLKTARNDIAFRLGSQRTNFLAHAEAEDRKLRKELALEVLALKVPFRNLLVFPNQVPWPGRLRTLHSLKT